MRTSPAMDLVWHTACQEAAAGEFAEIAPEHFLVAILKFSEMPIDELGDLAFGADEAREMVAEVTRVREDLNRRAIDSTWVRRELRGRLGRGGSPGSGGQKHRSQASRDAFDAAARLSAVEGRDVLTPEHLLRVLLLSPSPKMRDVLGDAVGPRPAGRIETPLLDRHGRDLLRAAAEGRLTPASDRSTECKALLQHLADSRRRSVLLVTEHPQAVESVLVAAARFMGSAKPPAGLTGRRILDVTAWKPSGRDAAERLKQWQQLLAEAASVPDVILFVPAIKASSNPNEAIPWAELLKTAIVSGGVPCVCQVNATAYQRWIRKDREWKQAAHVMWIHDLDDEGIPCEL